MSADEFTRVRKVGHVIRELNRNFKRRFLLQGTQAGLDEVTIMHGWIMGYLHCNENRDIYQKDIESDFGIRRSSVTSLVQMMEKKGYICRKTVPDDARLKKICLTNEGKDTAIQIWHTLEQMEELMLDGIDEQELHTFFAVADKIQGNLDRYHL